MFVDFFIHVKDVFIGKDYTNKKRCVQFNILKGPISKLDKSFTITLFNPLNNVKSVRKQVKSVSRNSLDGALGRPRRLSAVRKDALGVY